MRFKAGDNVRVKKFKERPFYWNCEGKMDHLMGKVVKIERVASTVNGRYVVHDSKNDYDWRIEEDDLEPVNETIVIYRKDREVIAVDKVTGDKAIARCNPADEYDFQIGAKLAFDRLMNGNKENITAEDMRKRLVSYCGSISCNDCKLKSSTRRCGNGVHFMTKDKAGDYAMSDEEIKNAYNIVFGTAPKLYNGKIVFTKGDNIFKTGHIYEVKGGRINTAKSGRVPTEEPLKDIEDVKDYFTGKCDGNRKRKRGWSPYTLELMEVKED
jgi:hypothetical protein